MNFVLKSLVVASLVAAPSMAFAHKGNGNNDSVDFAQNPGTYPAQQGHAASQTREQSPGGQPHNDALETSPGMPDQAGPKD